MRRLRILCALAVTIFAALALSIALENPASSANAQNPSGTGSLATTSKTAGTSSAAANLSASNGIAPAIVASNIGIRTLAAAPQAADAISKSAGTAAVASSPVSTAELYLTSEDKPNRIFSFAAPMGSASPVTAATKAASVMVPVAGIGAIGSVGDGGPATSAQFDLSGTDTTMRSGVAMASDGTIYVADSGNATIRMIAGAASSEPGIIRSVAGRWAPRQNVEISEPLGVAVDLAGDLFIADHGANAIDVLYGASSPKAGQLETLAHMVAPGSVAVTRDGSTVFASSAQTGVVLAVDTKTREIRTPAINPAALFATAQNGSTTASSSASSTSSSRISPTGLAVDGGSNLFIAYSNPGASYDAIVRLDAFSGKVTLAARGLSSPGDISFDVKGDLFVANQGMRNIVKFATLGVPATGVTLTAPVGACPDSDTIFCDQLIGGTSPTQPYELTNNTANPLTGITASFLTGNTGDFTVSNSSCTATIVAMSSCAFNVAFTPTATSSAFQTNDGTTCTASATTTSRCSALTVNYSGATAPLAAAATGIADDFQIVCVTSASTSCVDVPGSMFDQTTILQGGFATFQLQIVPDNTFSGVVNLVCPSNLPVSPAGAIGSPTTCGLSSGTNVTEPLTTTLAVNVVAGTPVAFNMTIQTTDTAGVQTQTPPTTPPPAARVASLAGLLASGSNRGGGNTSGPSKQAHPAVSTMPASAKIKFFALLFACLLFAFAIAKQQPFVRKHPAVTIFALALIIITVAGCGGSSKKVGTISFTPVGTYMLTVQGSAQDGARGYTCTLIVATGG